MCWSPCRPASTGLRLFGSGLMCPRSSSVLNSGRSTCGAGKQTVWQTKLANDGAWESRNSKVDALALQVNLFLASRVSFILSCDKDEGPLVIFPHEHKPKGPKVQSRRRSASQRAADPSRSADRALASFASPPARRVFPNPCFSKAPVDARFSVAPLGCGSCPSPAALKEVSENGPIQDAAKAGVQPAQHAPNKKRLIQMRLDGQECHGHRWVQGSVCNNNFTMKCEVCGLYVQQTHKPAIIMRLLQQPCKGLGEAR